MPVKAKRSWVPLPELTLVPVVGSDGKECGRCRKDSGFEIVEYDEQNRLWSQRIMSDARAMIALAPKSAHEHILNVELGQDDRAKEQDLNIIITELSAEGIVVHKRIGDKQHTIWKIGTSTDSTTKPTWRYRYPQKPTETVVPPNPNTLKDNGPPRKTRRSVRRKFERSNIIGRFEMTSWKRGAGRRKEWRKYRHVDSNKLRTEKNDASESQSDTPTGSWLYSNSAMPLSFLRAHDQNPVQVKKRKTFQRKRLKARIYTLKIFEEERRLEKAQMIRYQRQYRASWIHDSYPSWELKPPQGSTPSWRPDLPQGDTKSIHIISTKPTRMSAADFLSFTKSIGATSAKPTRISPADYLGLTESILATSIESISMSLADFFGPVDVRPADFLRLVVGSRGETRIVEEHFLTGYVTVHRSTTLKPQEGKPRNSKSISLRRFLISSFLRHDSHADIYVLQDPNDALEAYEGHLFFHEDMPGNWGKYGKRKLERLQKSKAFVGETKVNKRALVAVTSNPNEITKVKKSDAEFPVLPHTNTGPGSTTTRPRKKKRPLYAAILADGTAIGTQRVKHPSNHKAYQAWENRLKARQEPKLQEAYRRKGKKSEAIRQGKDHQEVPKIVSHCTSTNPFNVLSED